MNLLPKAYEYLARLCLSQDGRCVGTQKNRDATTFFAETLKSFSFQVDEPSFDCFDWEEKGARLLIGGEEFNLSVSPYSLPCSIKAPLCIARNLEDLFSIEALGQVVLLKDELTREQLMPKSFTFYNPIEHQEIIRCLETRGFIGALAATSYHTEVAGGVYPFPLIEDGDFLLPSGYMSKEEGDRLAGFAGKEIFLVIDTYRTFAKGFNVVASKGQRKDKRIVFFAHIDSKKDTPGALDNATGVITLLLLGELLRDYQGEFQIEMVALNGEDYYSNPGQKLYYKENNDKFTEIFLGVNIDGIGYYRGNSAYSLYLCPRNIGMAIQDVFSVQEGMVEGELWYQGDHSLFIANSRPALGLTSSNLDDLLTIVHTSKDKADLVNPHHLVQTALSLKKLITRLGEMEN